MPSPGETGDACWGPKCTDSPDESFLRGLVRAPVRPTWPVTWG